MTADPRQRVLGAIGKTPLIDLSRIAPAGSARLVATLESANPTGSMKDRVAVAFVCAALGYRTHFVFSDAFSDEKRYAMRAYGAEITDVRSSVSTAHSIHGTAHGLRQHNRDGHDGG